jgi:hypothetical protein
MTLRVGNAAATGTALGMAGSDDGGADARSRLIFCFPRVHMAITAGGQGACAARCGERTRARGVGVQRLAWHIRRHPTSHAVIRRASATSVPHQASSVFHIRFCVRAQLCAV